MKNTTVSVSFRLLKLDMMQAYTLKKDIRGAHFYHSSVEGVFVGVVPLHEAIFDELNDYVIRQQIQYDDCDVFVEAIKSAEAREVSVPRVVNKILKYIDCKLTYALRFE